MIKGKKVKKVVKRPKRAVVKSIKKIVSKKKIVRKKTVIEKKVVESQIFQRSESNPIISPKENNSWESKATLNPAAIYSDGKVHLIYRAIGNNDVSVLGYASSVDGVNIDERLLYPVFFKGQDSFRKTSSIKIPYSSGGGWNGGCEDPRLTLIEDTVYLLYTAFDGWGSLRMAMAMISLDDFLHKRFNWSQPVYISKPGEIHKNWVIFPEKIKGKFAILHSISPKVLIEYVDSLEELGRDKYINSFYGSRSASDEKVATRWDSWVRGAGPPPIKTKYGWLLLYHAMSDSDPNRYKLGAMILDVRDPSKVLYRYNKPILEPDECYENEGFKRGVVYSCGAVVIDGQLFVYYGGSDTVVCVARADLDQFLEQIISNSEPILKWVNKSQIKNIRK